MKIELSNVVSKIVETMLKRGTSNKLLHICIRADYLYFPHGYKNRDDCSDKIKETIFIHFIFYRPGSYTKVLLLESKYSMLDFNKNIFELKSNHDSCWRSDGVENSLFQIHQKIIELIEEKCEELDEPVLNLCSNQPNFSSIETIEILEGDANNLDYDSRKGKIMKNGEYINFVVIK